MYYNVEVVVKTKINHSSLTPFVILWLKTPLHFSHSLEQFAALLLSIWKVTKATFD